MNEVDPEEAKPVLPPLEKADLTTAEGRMEILIRERFPWSPEASTVDCQKGAGW